MTPSVFDITSGAATSSGSFVDVLDPSLELTKFTGTYPSDMLSEDYFMGFQSYQAIDDKTLTDTSAELEFGMTDPSHPECECPEDTVDPIAIEANIGFLLSARYPLANPFTILSAVNRAVEVVEEQEQSRQMTPFSTASNDETEFIQRQALVELPAMSNGVCNDAEVPSYFDPDRYYSNSNIHWEGTESAQAAIQVMQNALPERSDTGSEGSLDDMTNYWTGPI